MTVGTQELSRQVLFFSYSVEPLKRWGGGDAILDFLPMDSELVIQHCKHRNATAVARLKRKRVGSVA
jgi:hypothetical protein